MAFLLIVPDKTIEGERVFGLVALWTHLHQAHHHSLGEVAWKLALLINIGNDWAYAFAWLNEGTLHTPLSSEGHISVMIGRAPSMNACGHLSQLEISKFLQCGDQVVCPKGLNGELEPMQFTFSEPPVWNMDALGKPTCEPSLLQVYLSNMKLGDEASIASVPMSSMPPSSMHPTTKYPCEAASSMTTELQELLSWAMLDTSDLTQGILLQGGHSQSLQGPNLLPRRRVPSDQRVWTLPLLPQQWPSYPVMIPMLLQLSMHCLFPLHPKQYRWSVYLPFISPKPLSDLNQLRYQRACSNYRKS